MASSLRTTSSGIPSSEKLFLEGRRGRGRGGGGGGGGGGEEGRRGRGGGRGRAVIPVRVHYA